jgi:hypothetical protein
VYPEIFPGRKKRTVSLQVSKAYWENSSKDLEEKPGPNPLAGLREYEKGVM